MCVFCMMGFFFCWAKNDIYIILQINAIFWGVTVIFCDSECKWEWLVVSGGMGNVSAICCSTCRFAPLSQQRNLIKFIFDLLNGSHKSDGGETKEERAAKTLPSGCSLISASGSTGSAAGPLCFQMLHRLVPSLYNCYATYTDDPKASAFWNHNMRLHLQSFNFHQMIIWRKWKRNDCCSLENNDLHICQGSVCREHFCLFGWITNQKLSLRCLNLCPFISLNSPPVPHLCISCIWQA